MCEATSDRTAFRIIDPILKKWHVCCVRIEVKIISFDRYYIACCDFEIEMLSVHYVTSRILLVEHICY